MEDRPAYQAAGAGQQTVETTSSPLIDPGVDRARSRKSIPPATGLTFPRFFTQAGLDPFDEVEWETRTAVISNERGEVVFEQRDVEMPRAWSQQATNIVVSKYFRGQLGTAGREHSVRARNPSLPREAVGGCRGGERRAGWGRRSSRRVETPSPPR